MVNVNANALGIIFPNSYDNLVPELVQKRTMASVPFASRYRMIDFTLSAMVNAGIDNVTVVTRENYYSLMDHLGSGREWDLARKRGGLTIIPPYAQARNKLYHGRVEALSGIVGMLEKQKEKYVIISDCNVACSFDYAAFIDAHVASGADVSMVYERTVIPEAAKADNYTLTVDEDGRVTEILTNDYRNGVQNLSMNIYIMERETLVTMVKDAMVRNLVYFERDILARNLQLLHVQGYEYEGYRARISDLKSYFDENMRLLDPANLAQLFVEKRPVYTKIRDDNPTCYMAGSSVKNSLVADGCVLEGEVENCVLFRGVKIAAGAKVKNCVLMQDTVVEAGAELDHVVTDKNVTITEGKKLTSDSFPVYVGKGHKV